MGRTKRALQVRLNEHINNIMKGFLNHSVSKNYALVHNRDPKNTLFMGIDRYSPHWRGSSLLRGISQLEMKWIFTVGCFSPLGLNVDVDGNAFVNNS